MKKTLSLALAASLLAPLAAPAAFAAGDAAAGEKGFNKCKSCHTVTSDAGDVIIKGGRTGPNLWGVIGRTAGTAEGYKFSKDLIAAGEAGLVWDEENFAAFTADPRSFLREYLDNSKAKSKMTFKLRKGGEDIAAFLAANGPAPVAAPTEEAAAEPAAEPTGADGTAPATATD